MQLAVSRPVAEQLAEHQYKCHVCKHILSGLPPTPTSIPLCPDCRNPMNEMCPRDHLGCSHDITAGIAYCPDCGEPMCPECGAHDVVQISRVTGYMQEVSGWNAGKQAELKDRVRYDALKEEIG